MCLVITNAFASDHFLSFKHFAFSYSVNKEKIINVKAAVFTEYNLQIVLSFMLNNHKCQLSIKILDCYLCV